MPAQPETIQAWFRGRVEVAAPVPNLPLTATHALQAGKRTFSVQQRKGHTAVLWKEGDMV